MSMRRKGQGSDYVGDGNRVMMMCCLRMGCRDSSRPPVFFLFFFFFLLDLDGTSRKRAQKPHAPDLFLFCFTRFNWEWSRARSKSTIQCGSNGLRPQAHHTQGI
jgi:hypothetical protein